MEQTTLSLICLVTQEPMKGVVIAKNLQMFARVLNVTKRSRMGQVNFVEDCL